MKVIFLIDLKDQKTKKDDVRDVSDGYARNFLFPKKFAIAATPELLQQMSQKRERRAHAVEATAKKIQSLAGRLKDVSVAFTAKAHEGKLFGGIGAAQILKELARKGITLEEKQLKLEHPIKMVGEHRVPVHLGQGIEGEITVIVRAED